MLRISQLLRDAWSNSSPTKQYGGSGYVVIWNLTHRCNLSCRHCYAEVRTRVGREELSTQQAKAVIDDLARLNLFVLILSGGEPLLRSDLFALVAHAREKGISCALSTNGTLIDEAKVECILRSGMGYVGISIDGAPHIHDGFRGRAGAFVASLRALRLCRDAGIRVGLRFSLTSSTLSQLPFIFALFERESLGKLYLSHLNYSNQDMGRLAPRSEETHEAMRFVIDKALGYLQDRSFSRQIVTGNNNADAAYLLLFVEREYPSLADRMQDLLLRNAPPGYGGRLVNIDPWGEVHPDPFCRHLSLGNVRQTPLSQILVHLHGLSMTEAGSQGAGRCAHCRFFHLCGGNSPARTFAGSADAGSSDPSCYLYDQEILLPELARR